MKILVYGLQNSGATLFAFFVGQNPSSLVIPDLWTMYCAPSWNSSADLCVKATLTTTFSIEDHKESFQPDLTILVIRNPEDNYTSLVKKEFKNDDGLMEEKFSSMDFIFDDQHKFDYIVRFEDFVADPEKIVRDLRDRGWDIPFDAPQLSRTPYEMEMAVWRSSPELYKEIKWGTGNARVMPVKNIKIHKSYDKEAKFFSQKYAPRLCKHYMSDQQSDISSEKISYTIDKPHNAEKKKDFMHILDSFAKQNIEFVKQKFAHSDAVSDNSINYIISAYWHSRASSANASVDAQNLINDIIEIISTENSDTLIFMIAGYFFEIGKLEISRLLLKHVINKGDYDTKHCKLVAEVMWRTGDLSEAEKAMRYELTFEPRSVHCNYLLAKLLWDVGGKDESRKLLNYCLALEKDFKPAQEMLTYIS